MGYPYIMLKSIIHYQLLNINFSAKFEVNDRSYPFVSSKYYQAVFYYLLIPRNYVQKQICDLPF